MTTTPTKSEVRSSTWAALRAAGAARFPGVRGRIPNFVGAEAAARRLAEWEPWKAARVIKCNPDSPQRSVRRAALDAGKIVYLPAPKLSEELPFIELDPARLPPGSAWEASSIKGAFALGRPVSLEEMRPLDLIVTGCVAVTELGARLGKGGGYADLEYALLREVGKVGPDTPIVTTVHAVQVLDDGAFPMAIHDISLDAVITPDRTIRCGRTASRPDGILWDRLSPEKIAAIPVLVARQPPFEGSSEEGRED